MNFSLDGRFVYDSFYTGCRAHYRVSKVKRKHTKLNHDHPDCFTNDIICSS